MPIISEKLKKQEKKAAAAEKRRKEEEERKQREEQAKKEQEEREAKEKEEAEKKAKKMEKKAKHKAKKDAAKKAKEDLERKANMRREMAAIRKCAPAKQVRDEAAIERQGLQILRTEVKSGHYSKIYKAKKGDQQDMVCKVVILDKTPIPYRQNLTNQALQINRYIGGGTTEANKSEGGTEPKHPGLIRVVDIFVTDKKAYTFMAECDPKSVESKYKGGEKPSEDEVKNIIKQLAEILKYLHSVGVAHNNLKTSHLIFDKENKLKLCGLGSASFYWDSDMEQVVPRKQLSIKEWPKHQTLPPEAFTSDFDGSKADIWQLGLILVQLLAGKEIPFKIKKAEEDFTGQWRTFCQNKNCFTEEAKQFLEKIFVVEGVTRPTAAELLEHPYLTGAGGSSAPATEKPDKPGASPGAGAGAPPGAGTPPVASPGAGAPPGAGTPPVASPGAGSPADADAPPADASPLAATLGKAGAGTPGTAATPEKATPGTAATPEKAEKDEKSGQEKSGDKKANATD